jgi:hypothetical protein
MLTCLSAEPLAIAYAVYIGSCQYGTTGSPLAERTIQRQGGSGDGRAVVTLINHLDSSRLPRLLPSMVSQHLSPLAKPPIFG